jgi:hypothetical protein
MAPNDRLRAPDRLLETETGSPSALRKQSSSLGLPEDVLREASRRVGVLCLISASVWAANLLLPGPEERPANAWELADQLSRCEVDSPWTREDARQWWHTRLNPEPAVIL